MSDAEQRPPYTLDEVARLLNYGRETTRRILKDRPDVIRRGKLGHYRVPADVLEQIKRDLSVSRGTTTHNPA